MKLDGITLIRFSGKLEVGGIFNYNGPEKLKGNDNHIGAKRVTIRSQADGDAMQSITKEVDYTSSRCIRHELFADLAPRQPTSADFKANFLSMATSELGIVRGYLNTDGPKRASPLSIHDAYTTELLVDGKPVSVSECPKYLVIDQGSSSKPKESGGDGSDTSMFSKQNAPRRYQDLRGAVNIRQLQFLELTSDSDFRVVSKDKEVEYVSGINQLFACKPALTKEKFKIKSALDHYVWEGLLLPDDILNRLITSILSRIYFLEAYKTSAYLRTKQDDFVVEFVKGHDVAKSCTLKAAIELTSERGVGYHAFFERTGN